MAESQNEVQSGSPKLRQFIVAFTATLSAFAAGTMIVWTSPVLPILIEGKEEPKLTTDEGSWVSSLLTIGAFLGCLQAGRLADLIGRKLLLLVLTIPMSVSWLLLVFHPGGVWGVYVGRLVGGFALGVISVTAPVYIADTAQPSVRGAYGVLFQFQLVLGVLFMYCVGLMETVFSMSLLCALLPFVFLASFFWVPESPTYLLMKKDNAGAKKALQWLRATGSVHSIMEGIVEKLESETSSSGPLDLVKNAVPRKALCLALGLMVIQQGCGINAVLFYTVQIFQMSGSSISPPIASISIGVCCTATVALATIMIEKTGRRVLLLASCGGMAVSLAGLAFFMESENTGPSVFPVASLTAYCLAFSIGLGPIPWLMMAELFPGHQKSAASSMAASTSWGLAFVVTKYFSALVRLIGIGGTFGLFAAVCGLGVVFIACLIPETKGRAIEDILLELGEKPSRTDDENVAEDTARRRNHSIN